MNLRTTAPLHSTTPNFKNTEANNPGSGSNPVYVRSSGTTAIAENAMHAKSHNRATDGVGGSTFYTAHSLIDLKEKSMLAAQELESQMKPGDVIDLGLLEQGPARGYLCRRTASGDGYVVQTHEQAKPAPFSGLFIPAINNPHGSTTMDMMPVTDVNQIPPQMYKIMHSLTRFVSRQPIEQLLMNT